MNSAEPRTRNGYGNFYFFKVNISDLLIFTGLLQTRLDDLVTNGYSEREWLKGHLTSDGFMSIEPNS
jgi:hypothetical protein